MCVVQASDKRITCDEEFSDSGDEGAEGGARRNAANHKKGAKRPRVEDEEKKKNPEEKKPGQSSRPIMARGGRGLEQVAV